jgi:signal transduction histidine kinase
MLALVWTPTQFAPGWDVVVHAVDVAVFALWTVLPDDVANPSVVYYLFAIVCAILRWQLAGALWTAAAAVGADLGLKLSGAVIDPVDISALAPRAAYLVVIAALVAYVGTHHVRFHYEIGRLAAWPRKPVGTRSDVVAEILSRSSECLRSPRTVLVWEEPDEEWVNVAWQTREGMEHIHAPEGTYGSCVLPSLADLSFQTRDAGDDRAHVVILRAAGFRRRRCRPVAEGLRARFDMHAVQSWPLRGELVRGRLFCLDVRRMRLDDLVLGEVVASLAATRLESYYWNGRMRGAAALEERVRLAGDVHDHVLQAQAGTALQLLAARRVLELDPREGRQLLSDVQEQMERDELDMRSFVARLRPTGRPLAAPQPVGLRERIAGLRARVSRQWEIRVALESPVPENLPEVASEGVYRLVQESVINAAKHSDASVVRIAIIRHGDTVRITVRDDGRGFRFHGTYDLADLDRLADGPVALKERVAALGGDLIVTSSSTGADLAMTLPIARPQAETT